MFSFNSWGERMSQSELEPKPVQVNVTMGDASDLPLYHVNVMNIRAGIDEFYFTWGVVLPPEQAEIAALTVNGQVQAVAQPIFRFALSRDTMEKFLTLMASTFDQQTKIIEKLHQKTSEKEGRNE